MDAGMIGHLIQCARHHSIAFIFCGLLLQAGCATTTVIPAPKPGVGAALDWTLRGKMSLNSDQGRAKLQIHWQQQGDEFDIHLLGPLGQAAAHVYGSGDSIQVDMAGQSREYGAGEIAVIEDSVGWEVPVSEMSYWVRGLPVPELVHQISYDDQGLPEWLLQSGWRVDYQKYKQQAPVRTVFSRDSVRILLVVKEWRLNDSQ
jgi:outer membrane lipoprotein LolB